MGADSLFLGHYLTPIERQMLYLMTMREFKKPKHMRTTPYLLLKKLLKENVK